MTNVSDTPEERTLEEAMEQPIHALSYSDILRELREWFGDIDWIEIHPEGEKVLLEAAAGVYVIAHHAVSIARTETRIAYEARKRANKRAREYKEQRDGLDNELTKAQERIRELEPPGRPDPLALALPRKRGEPPLVAGETCLMGGLVVMKIGRTMPTKAECPKCTRVVKITKAGKYPQHKVPA